MVKDFIAMMFDQFISQQKPGVLNFGGARMAMFDIQAGFWGLRRQIEALVGPHLTNSVLQQAGANGGASFASSFIQDPSQETFEKSLRDCLAAYQAAGFGQFTIENLDSFDERSSDEGRVMIHARDTFEAWAARQHGKPGQAPICAYTAGVLVGFVNVLAGRNDIVCVEQSCMSQGDEICRFELMPISAGDKQIDQMVAVDPDPALSRRLNLLEILFDRMPMGIVLLDTDFKIRRFNPTWADFVASYIPATSRPVTPGFDYSDLVPGFKETIEPVFQKVLTGEMVVQDAFELKLGEDISYWDAVYTPLLENGEVVGILQVVIDVTERVRANQELQQALKKLQAREERLTLVMQGINDGVWDWDLESNQVYYSPRWKSMLGYTDEEISNQLESWQALIHPDDLEKAQNEIQRHLDGHIPQYKLEHRLRHKDGSYRWILARGQALRNEAGEPYRMVGSHTDITERKLVEESLRQSESNLRSLMENARNFTVYQVAIDPDNQHGGRVVMVSPSIKEILGISDPYDFDSWFKHFHADDLSRVLESNRRAVEEGVPYSETARWYHPNKEDWIWIHTASTPVYDINGKISHFNGLIIDISDQKEAEAALHYQAAFESLVASISTRFINLETEQIDNGIRQALQQIGEFMGVDRGTVFRFSSDKTMMDNTHEWCAAEIEAQCHSLQDIPVGALPWATRILSRRDILHLPKVGDFSSDHLDEKYVPPQSLLVVPMIYQDETLGFVSFESIQSTKDWAKESIQLFQMLGAIFANALKHKQAQAIQAGQRQYLELLATGGDFTETLQTLIRIIEEQWPGMLGLVLLLDEDGEHLHIGASESLPEDYLQSIEGLKIGPQVDSCGTAAYLGERVIVEDIVADSRWDGLRDLAVKHGLYACWSEPVFSPGGDVVGTFAMYYRHRRSPTPEELRTIEIGAHLAGVAIERKRSDEALRESQRMLSTLISNLPGMAYRCRNDRNWTMEFVSEGSLDLTGYRPDQLIDNQEISYGQLVHPDNHKDVWDDIQNALDNKSSFQISYRLNTPEGEKWVWEQGQGVYNQKGDVIALEGFITDITERVIAQQHLEQRVTERTRELSSLLDISHNLASTLDLEQLLDLILDQLGTVVAYDAASIMHLDESSDLKVLAYRGPISRDEALNIQFPLDQARANREVIQRQEPIIIDDIRAESAIARGIRETAGSELDTTYGYLRCWMGVPLIVKDKVIGMLTLDHSEPCYYASSQAELAMAFANQAAVAIENARLYLETERRAKESEALFSVQQAIASRLDMAEILQMIADEARRLTNTDISAVYLLDRDELEISYVAGDVPESIRGYRLDVDDSIAGRVIQSQEAILVPDTWTDSRVDRAASDRVQARSLLIVPLVSSDEPIGTITVANRTPGGFTPEDERLLTRLAANVVISIENARLYQSEHDRRQVAEGLRDILAILNSDLSLDEILETIIAQACRLLEAEAGVAYQFVTDDDLIGIEAAWKMPDDFLDIDSLPLFETEVNQAILEGRPFAVSDFQARLAEIDMDAFPENPNITTWRNVISEHFRSYLSIPIMIKDHVYGAISLFYAQSRKFSDEEIDLTVTLADQAALAIENAQLRSQVERSAIAAERDRLARDLHDAVTQTLFSTSLIAEVLPRIWEKNPEQGRARLEEIRTLTRGALAEMRSLLMELRPSALMDTALPDLLRQLTEAFTGRSGVPVQLDLEGDCQFSPDVKVAVYRVTQEALNNVAKHARAKSCQVVLHCSPDDINLVITDDGEGFDPNSISPDSLGVGIMRERAEQIGAKLSIDSTIGKGTQVEMIWKKNYEERK